MRARFVMIAALLPLSAACTVVEVAAPIQGTVPPLETSPMPIGPAGAAPMASAPVVLGPSGSGSRGIGGPAPVGDPIRQSYDDAVRRGKHAEANRIGLGMMAGSEPCGPQGSVIAPPGPFTRPCGVAPLDDFSLRRRQR